MKIFMGITEIAGHYAKLKDGFVEMGVGCTFVDLFHHPFEYEYVKSKSILMRVKNLIIKKRSSLWEANFVSRYWWMGSWIVLNIVVFVYAAIKYDVFIFGFNSSFRWSRGLPVLRFLNKKIICRFHGADVRQPYMSGGIVAEDGKFNIEDIIKMSRKKKRQLKRIERFADIVISNPLFSHLLECPFICATRIGIPCSNKAHKAVKYGGRGNISQSNNKNIRILHAPSHPAAKGTNEIRHIIRRLEKKGYPLDYIEIQGKPNHVVLHELSRCDFVVDQLYSETPMAGFVAEAACFSKSAVVGGYASEAFNEVYPDGKIPPSNYCHPDSLESSILKMIRDEDYRLELGRSAKKFVDENWTPKKVAKRYLQLISNNIPKDWWYNPDDITYLHGSGLREAKAKKMIRSIVEVGGRDALQLSDKQKLESLFLEFAYS